MDAASWILLFLLGLIIAVGLQRLYDVRQKIPAGPINLPLVGRLPFLVFKSFMYHRNSFYEAMSCDGSAYGDFWSIRVGTRQIVVLSSIESIQEALIKQGDAFAGRPIMDYYTVHRMVEASTDGSGVKGAGGIGFSRNQLWKEHRRFAMRVLKDFGMGKNLSQTSIQAECASLLSDLSSTSGQAINPNLRLTKAVSNIICQLVFGHRMAYEDPNFDEYIKLVKQTTQSSPAALFMPLFFTFLDNDLFYKLTSAGKYLDDDRRLIELMGNKVTEIEASFVDDAEPSNYVEAYLREKRRLEDAEDAIAALFSRKQLYVTVSDLFVAGTDTTSNSLNWAFIYMALHPDWQREVRVELDSELGSSPNIAFVDRLRCPKSLAFLDEVSRHCSLVPHNGEKAVLHETWFRGYRVSPKAYIIADLRSVHYDPKLWPQPEVFDPRRFLNEDGEYKPSKNLIPFSIGKRSCLGESLARMELFLFFASVMRSFSIELDEATKALGEQVLVGTDGVVHAPREHKLIFTKRQQD